MEKLIIVKIGGNVINDDTHFHSFLKDFTSVEGKKILVHGGGKIATEIGNKLGIQSKYIDGRRITDDETIDLVTMVYGGLINKRAVALLQSFGCNAIGITGADGNLIPAKKRPVQKIDYGWVGDINPDEIPSEKWVELIMQDFVPVVAPLTHDGKGHILNTNADTIASALATALSGKFDVTLLFCFEKKGILTDVNDASSIVNEMDKQLYEKMKHENQLFAGILPKLQNAFEVKESGINQVIIGHSDDLQLLIAGEAGTQIL